MPSRVFRKQIVHLVRRYAPLVGGVETHLQLLNQELLNRGYKITVITEQTTPDLPRQEIIDGIKIIRLPVRGAHFKLKLWKSLWAVRHKWLGAERIHIHDVFFWMLPFWPLVSNKLHITFHGYEGSVPPNWRQIGWHRLAAVLTKNNLCIGDFHRKWYGVKPTNISYGAVEPTLQPSKKNKHKRLLYIGRLHADTGIMEYLQAAKLLHQQGVKFSLDIMGDGPLAAQVTAYIKKHQLPVTQHGFVANAAAKIGTYDVLFVSRYLAILEALSAKKPVIAHYNNEIKYDYLALAPFAEWIHIIQTPEEIALSVQAAQSTIPPAAKKWVDLQTWSQMADTYEQLWYAKPHLVYLNQSLGMGGAETFMTDLLQSFKQLGWQVTAAVAHKPFQAQLIKAGIPTSHIPIVVDIVGDWKGLIKGIALAPIAIGYYLQIVWKLRHADIFLASSFAEKLFGSLACWLLSKPIIWIEFASVEPLLKKFAGFPGLWYKLALRVPRKIITSSEHSATQLKKELPSAAEKLTIIPCGLTLPANQSSAKKEPATIVCVSRLEPGKGQDILLKAMPAVLSAVPEAQLKIIGTGDFLPTLQKLSQKLNIQEEVQFLGFVEDVYPHLTNATICVFPTLWKLEGFGMVAIEAMAAGTPVVAFNFGPLPEIIRHKKTGLLANVGDSKDLAQQIITLLQNPVLATKLQKSARQEIKKRFTIETVTQRYQEIFITEIRND